jgi:hypothetical protein
MKLRKERKEEQGKHYTTYKGEEGKEEYYYKKR